MISKTTIERQQPMIGRLRQGRIAWAGMVVLGVILALTQVSFGMGLSPNIEKVAFTSQGSTIKGNLYLPEASAKDKKYAAVVVTGAWTTVKEQMPATYAKALSEKGYAALTFDFRGWGESIDNTKYLENPKRKIQDILAAVAYLSDRSDINPTQIAGLGICASSGYMAHAAATSCKISALAMVAPWLHDAEIVRQVYGGEEGVQKLIAMGRKAEKSSEPVLIEAASKSNEKSLMYNVPYYTERDRGLIPEYDNRFNVASWEGWLTFDAQQAADHIHVPTLLVHSRDAAIPQGVEAFETRMGNTARIVWLDTVSQFDFYDRPDAVTRSVELVSDHFKKTFAVASADIRAEHYVQGLFWEIKGTYDYELIRDKKVWKIAGLTLNFEKEEGTRDVLEIAGKRAAQHPDLYITHAAKTKDAIAINIPSIWAKPGNPVAPGSENNENLKLVMKMFDAYAKGDTEVLRQLVAEDIGWYIPGRHPLSGIKRGVDELISFFEELKDLGFKAEVMILAANDNYVIDAHRGWNTKGNKKVDLNWILLYQIVDGKIKRVQNFSGDLYTSDHFFSFK